MIFTNFIKEKNILDKNSSKHHIEAVAAKRRQLKTNSM
jgi:hypothetical protein